MKKSFHEQIAQYIIDNDLSNNVSCAFFCKMDKGEADFHLRNGKKLHFFLVNDELRVEEEQD